MKKTMRLDKFMGSATELSRRQIQVEVRAGNVSINGVTAHSPAQQISDNDQVIYAGQQLKAPGSRYLMLYKPAGYVCANTDSEHPTVLNLIHEPHAHQLQIAGRLDLDTTGLVLLTDDGRWNHRMTSPRRECHKIYRVTTAEPIAPDVIGIFAQGMLLHGEKKITLPAHLELLDKYEARLHLQEGKYHQVKRMFAALGNRVTQLHREAIGHIPLDPTLQPGQYRLLTAEEITHG